LLTWALCDIAQCRDASTFKVLLCLNA